MFNSSADECNWQSMYPTAHVTRREYQIAACCAEGLTCVDTAKRLGITKGSVKVYRKRLYDKLGIANSATLTVMFARGQFVIGPPIRDIQRERHAAIPEVEFAIHPAKQPKPAPQPSKSQLRKQAENEKWAKIFDEKFADPGYYEVKSTVRLRSTLSSL